VDGALPDVEPIVGLIRPCKTAVEESASRTYSAPARPKIYVRRAQDARSSAALFRGTANPEIADADFPVATIEAMEINPPRFPNLYKKKSGRRLNACQHEDQHPENEPVLSPAECVCLRLSSEIGKV